MLPGNKLVTKSNKIMEFQRKMTDLKKSYLIDLYCFYIVNVL